jgi:hypothetical protein
MGTALMMACGGPGSGPSSPPPPSGAPDGAPGASACTEMGCEDGFSLDLIRVGGDGARQSPWPPGAYRFVAAIDGEEAVCEGSLPLSRCDAGPTLTCHGAAMEIAESGCALDPSQHGFASIRFGSGLVRSVSLRVERDGAVVAEGNYTPTYQTVHPNGPRCEPRCQQAGDALTVK